MEERQDGPDMVGQTEQLVEVEHGRDAEWVAAASVRAEGQTLSC